MKTRCSTIFSLLAILVVTAGYVPRRTPTEGSSHEPMINVLLARDVPSALIEVKGEYRVDGEKELLSYGLVGKRFLAHGIENGLRWGEEFLDSYSFRLTPTSVGGACYVNGMQYSGSILVYHTHDARITIVNEVPIEDFLNSTLALRFDQPLSDEALAALVITARTDAHNRVLQHQKDLWDITADTSGYFGLGVTMQGNGIEAAVKSTRNMVIKSLEDPGATFHLSPLRAEEIASLGSDAKRILQTVFPHATLDVLVAPNPFVQR